MNEPLFLTLAEAVDIHIESALAQPQASFAGEWLHKDLFEMAAAYAFHICENHPFIDGNKRAALASALVFLELNGVSIEDPKRKLLHAMLKMASGKLDKGQFAQVLRSFS